MRNLFLIGSICATAMAQGSGWHFENENPISKKKVVEISAVSFEQLADGQAKLLHDVTARLYDSTGSYKEISTKEAVVDLKSAKLFYGPHLKMVARLRSQP